jgi:hypothetical protein
MKLIKATIILFGLTAWQGVQAQDIYPDSIEVSDNPLGFGTIQKEKTVEHTIIANYMPGWITSKVFTPHHDYSWQGGHGYEVGYRCLFSSGYGFGLNYSHSQTNFTYGYELGLNYAGVSFIYGGHVAQQWILTTEIGLGYANYTDAGRKMKDGVGNKYCVGVEYMLGRAMGIGIGVSNHRCTFSKDKDIDYYDSDKYVNGFNRLSVNVGFRLYL